ncbi:MAG: hypothetical protein LBH86_01630 [Oscillospiraceae bacterium]|jgi:DNA polymerase III delta prime subunit|nr:hypothetical protein [Oscillospiraceae bacterium]
MSTDVTHPEGARRHAVIISGGTEEARRAEALRIAAEALCLSAEEDRPCGRCAACRKLYGVGHADVLFLLTPPEDKKWMPVSHVRHLRGEMYVRPNEGRRKIAVINADILNPHGQNALLSVLEDPPYYAVLLLLAQNAAVLLPTVRSRCALRRLPPSGGVSAEAEAIPEVEAVLAALRADDEWEILCACFALEKIGRESLSGALDQLAAGVLREIPGADVLTARRYGDIIVQIRRWQAALDFHVSAGHICGALAVALAPQHGTGSPTRPLRAENGPPREEVSSWSK